MIKKLLKIAAAFLFLFQILLNVDVALAGDNDDDPNGMVVYLYKVNGRCTKLKVLPEMKISKLDQLFGENTEYIYSGRVLGKDSDFGALENGTKIVAVTASCANFIPKWLKLTQRQDSDDVIMRHFMDSKNKGRTGEKARIVDMRRMRRESSRKGFKKMCCKAMYYGSQKDKLGELYVDSPTVIPERPQDIPTEPLPILR